MPRENTVLFPPTTTAQSVAPAPEAHIETKPLIGYRGVRHEFVDAEHIPRIAIEADETVPFETVMWLRRVIERIGMGLPERESRRLPTLFGPRLLP